MACGSLPHLLLRCGRRYRWAIRIWRRLGKSAAGPRIEDCGYVHAGGLRLDSDRPRRQDSSRFLGSPL